jgi:hypothetical protein
MNTFIFVGYLLYYFFASTSFRSHQLHRIGRGKVPSTSIVIYYASTIFVLLSSAIITSQIGSKMIRFGLNIISVFLSVSMLILFGKTFLAHKIFDIAIAWVPFANIACIVLANYVDTGYDNLMDEVDSIEKHKYVLRTA